VRLDPRKSDPKKLRPRDSNRRSSDGAKLQRGVYGSALALSLGLWGCDPKAANRDEKSEGPHVAVLDFRGGIAESAVSGGFFPRPADQTYVGLVRKLAKASDDPNIRGIYVRVGEGMTFHVASEIGDLLAELRQKRQLPVVCHAHSLSNASASFMLRACDERWLSAAGDASTVGIAAEVVYLKGAFDKLGVVADMLSMGRYKSGGEALTREGPSEASAQNLTQTLANLRTIWLDRSALGAPPELAERWKVALEDGPWSPPAALAQGLVTHVGYEDEATSSIKSRSQSDRLATLFGSNASSKSDGIGELVRFLASQKSQNKTARIAVLPLVGSITMEGGGAFGDSGIAASSAVKALRKLREDENVKAVVLRLDSPGGSPLASDLIWRELMLMRKQKPVVASIGSMAASGGYYIASGATKIVAPDSAIVGSIGVFGGKIVFGEALGRLGVTSHAFPANPDPVKGLRALHESPLSLWDDPTRARVRENMQHIYDLFVSRVAEGRGIPADAVYQTAEGAIFLATTGKERGLIDELGGASRALSLARELAGLAADTPVSVEGAEETIWEALFLDEGADEEDVRAALSRFEARQRQAVLALGLSDAELAALGPFRSIVLPLLSGENVVAALPWAITLR
jgi:protease IV